MLPPGLRSPSTSVGGEAHNPIGPVEVLGGFEEEQINASYTDGKQSCTHDRTKFVLTAGHPCLGIYV
jgi:hypothetical protein